MIYDISQTTGYVYAYPVPVARHVVRMVPVDRPRQRVIASHFSVEPEPVEWSEATDFFGNRVAIIRIETPHTRFTVRTSARVDVAPAEFPEPEQGPTWEEVREEAANSFDLSPASPVHHLYASPAVPLTRHHHRMGGEKLPCGAADARRRHRPDEPAARRIHL